MADSSQNPSQIRDLYPDGSVPEVKRGIPQGFAQRTMTPLGVTGLLRSIVASLLSEPDSITNPRIREQITQHGPWRETSPSTANDTTDANPETGILVESTLMWRPDRQGARPAVWVHGQDWTWQRLGIGNKEETDMMSGMREYSGHWVGAHTLFVSSRQPAEAAQLGWEIGTYLQQYSSVIGAAYFDRFEVTRVGAVGTLQSQRDLFAVPIDIAYLVQFRWQLQPEAPRFQRLRTLIS